MANKGPPPYTPKQANEAEAFLDHILQADRQNVDEIARQSRAASFDAEVERMRNLLVFTLSVDYQCNNNVSLSAGDREHFTKLYNLLQDLEKAHDNARPTAAEREQLAPYFWKYLHEPCKALEIPVDLVLAAIWRLTTFTDHYGRYKGCCFGLLQRAGLDALARKLYFDKNILIPRLIEPGLQRQKALRGVEEISILYFDKIHGFDNSTAPSDFSKNWSHVTSVSYDANARGLSYEKLRKQGTLSSRLTLSMSHLTLMAQRCVNGIVKRHEKVEAGEATKQPDHKTWNGAAPYTGSWNGGPTYPYSVPRGWMGHTTNHVPEFFEERDMKGFSDV